MTPVQIRHTLPLDESAANTLADLLVPVLRQTLAPPPPTVDETKRQARLLGVCEKTLQRMSRSGEMPPLIKIGRAVRWSYPALKAWVEAGCPPVKNGQPLPPPDRPNAERSTDLSSWLGCGRG